MKIDIVRREPVGDDENHVAMLIAGRQLTPSVYRTWVSTAQVAPLILQALGTNHGDTFVVIRDVRPRVDYDVSDYFTFSPRGFSPDTSLWAATLKRAKPGPRGVGK